ncbi:hypothetical protein GGTG_08591 [Gaeumannomyces tritici R3-111a-1]|uniref:SGNH hydrolase-type esterase domain-containing protein n=1 Tax=Gaeumannomyces tritici (strain R3-111a-1) TaxID=644352 RepID=J3P505_GAET3|nr:hypothetical protein GGTG_08591 [Gaeumannomyces tritici R3-111a-1]EJT74753.1 hypothetical protein GGTG_08591 [Gaeumannomyces tritici R3-111a-1]
MLSEWQKLFPAVLAVLAAGCADAQKAEFPLRAMPIGASITAGFSAGKLTDGYREPLLERLVADGWQLHYVGTQRSGNSAENHHEGYPGIRTQPLANQTRAKGVIDQFKPNLLLLNVGTNDCTARLTREEARRIHSDMIDAVFGPAYAGDAATAPLLITSTLLPRRESDQALQDCTRYFNEEIRDLARTHPRSAQIALADMNNGSFITVDDLAPGDNLHPSAEGYAKMAAVWYEALNANLDKLHAPVSV